MSKTIFVSLPVTDIKASTAFYASLGFTGDPRFSEETSACMVWSDTISFMLLTHARWRTFTSRPIPPGTSSEVMLALLRHPDGIGVGDLVRDLETRFETGGDVELSSEIDHTLRQLATLEIAGSRHP